MGIIQFYYMAMVVLIFRKHLALVSLMHFWMEQGGLYVVVNLRGGSEYGDGLA